jgi:regulator of protease activity HflC (stomatin/prohibitin superfamily)
MKMFMVKYGGFFLLVLLALIAMALTGCTKVETGEVGLAKSFNGSVSPDPVGVGFHQTLTQTVLVFSAKESIFPIKDLHPQTRDKLTMEDVDISYSYHVNPQAIADLYTHYGPTAHYNDGHEIYPMATFVANLLRSAVNDAIARYDALAVNDNRPAIQQAILDDVRQKIAAEKLDGKVNISQVILTKVSIPKSVTQSATEVVTAQNALKAKQFELQTTQVEAQRIKALADQADERYIRYLNAQAMLKIAETRPQYVIIPQDFGKGGFATLPPLR